MQSGWILVAVGVALLALGIYLFGTYVLAIHNWQAMLTSIAGLVVLTIGIRSTRGTGIGRAPLVALGVFLCLLAAYVLLRGEWDVSQVPESMVLFVAGVVLFLIGIRKAPPTEAPSTSRAA